MSKHFRVSGLLPAKLEELSLSPAAVLRHAELPATFFEQEKIYVTTDEMFALWRAIEALSPDPLVGIKIGNEDRIERYDPIAIASLYTRNFTDAMERAARYKQLTCPEKIELAATADTYTVRFVWMLARDTEPSVFTDMCFAWVQAIGRRGTGRALTPLRVDYARPPAHREELETHFGCPVRFNAKHNLIVFRRSDIERPFVTHNADLLAAISPQLEKELVIQNAGANAGELVKLTIKRVLAGRRPDIRDIAREIGQSVRTLQRRLAASGLTYQQVMENARRELAHHYLRHSALELNETAYLLGYEDANSFFRAFHRWEGMPPGRWRKLHRERVA
ncbi:AraC family transcriptional regulator [Synoicihabitans lomoniglobus]|uniref:AraC family transcriptional regulator ligand-binding domain-containing protein n=1 Tax=Synoicihabitans lomoniglobus TaxID=2909285 RepID=A0AAF0A0H3_9BACT|nr:AraC family transcriptional regulator [Opitutaceae bacterium LMO-M01]WED64237.1 AraC family transcriptional regulator ligand-binding domain-containing protein [Opitutaceae bacterium LMO-M01]